MGSRKNDMHGSIWTKNDQSGRQRVKLPCFAFVHLLFTATCSPMYSPVNQTNRFFHGFLSDAVEITLLRQLFTSGSVNIVE